MKRQIIINTNSLIKSDIPIDYYVILQIIYEKDIDLFNFYKKDLDGIQALEGLERAEFLKYTGERLDIDLQDPESIDILDFILLEKATKLFETDNLSQKVAEVKDWIQDYRDLFKGIKMGSMGDPNACTKKMSLFLKSNPNYSKEDILKATKNYIKNTEPRYTMQADYFISKVDNNKIQSSRLLMWLEQEEIQNELSNTESTYTEKI